MLNSGVGTDGCDHIILVGACSLSTDRIACGWFSIPDSIRARSPVRLPAP
jgi:hypothetical protein